MTIRPTLLLAVLVMLPACQSLSLPNARSSCSFEQIWDTAIASLEGGRLQSADKSNGRIETAWMEVESATRAGLFQRDVNRERLKYIIDVKSEDGGATANVQQLREAWSPMGVRMRQWRAMPPNSAEERAVANEISRRLKEKGC